LCHHGNVAALTFQQARETVLATVRAARAVPPVEECELAKAAGRILAEDIAADRDTPALARSVRDGFAVRSADLPGDFEVIGEVRAGERFTGRVGPRQAVEIMTGAPIPAGADAVVMVEHVARADGRMSTDRTAEPQQFINPQACEAAAGQVVLRAGERLDYTGIAMLAAFGKSTVKVYRRPSVAIVPYRRRDCGCRSDSRGVSSPQFECVLAGSAGCASRRRAFAVADRARHHRAHPPNSRAGDAGHIHSALGRRLGRAI
jgi:molybdopterin biosynthesis enzyme